MGSGGLPVTLNIRSQPSMHRLCFLLLLLHLLRHPLLRPTVAAVSSALPAF